MIDLDRKGCRKCEFCKEIHAFDGFSFLGCTCAPNKGKPCFDIKDEDCQKKTQGRGGTE